MATADEHDFEPNGFSAASIPGVRLGWVQAALICIAWIVLWRASFLLSYGPFANIWYPPAGLSFAAMLLYGWRGVFPVAVASYVTAFWIDRMYGLNTELSAWWFIATSSSLAHIFSYAVGALFLRQFITMSVIRSLPGIIFGFLALGVITSLLAAFFGVQVQISTGSLSAFNLYSDWLARWIGDMVGVLVLTPFFLAVMSRNSPAYSAWLRKLRVSIQPSPMSGYLSKIVIILSLLYVFILLAWWFDNADAAFAVFFLVIPQMWLAYTENAFRAVTSIAIFSTSVALGVALFGLGESAMVYQFAICVIAATVYFGLAVPIMLAQSNILQYQAHTDHLTGVANRRYFIEAFAEELERSQTGRYPLAVAVFDIHQFRELNNAYGHHVGDKVLIEVAKLLQQEIRASDLIGRLSGNAFILCLPARSKEVAERYVDYLLQQLGYLTISELNEPLKIRHGLILVNQEETVDTALTRLQQLFAK